MMNAREVSPFTPLQWQELEHQALIFKYMASGVPIPPDLLYTFRRSLEPMSQRFFSPKTMQWGCFQMGLGNNADPEPGRCRRTDGKKWRCSKDAFQDSKYCEKHMHRGKNRSRKPVETATTSTNPTTNPSVTRSSNAPSIISTQNNQIYSNNPLQHTFINPLSSPSCSLNKTSDFDLMSRSLQGFKDDIGEHSLFSGGSGTTRNVHDSIPLNNLSPPYPSLIVGTHSQSLRNSYTQSQIQKEQSCFVMGTDFKSERSVNVGREEEEAQQPIRHFFDEWPPPKNRDSWIDLEEDRVNGSSFSTTQLSISFPMASPEFSVADAQSNDGDR